MKRALAVSLHFPAAEQAVQGVFQRLDVGMRALAANVDVVDFLCLDTPHRATSPQLLVDWGAALRKRWGDNVVLHHRPVQRTDGLGGRRNFLRGLFDARHVLPLARVLHEDARAALAEALQWQPDLVFAHRLGSMAALCQLPRPAVAMPVVFDLDDVEHVVFARQAWHSPGGRGRKALLHWGALWNCERRAIGRASVTLVCSEADRRRLAGGGRRIEVLPNSVVVPPVAAGGTDATPTITFVGTYDYGPNVDAGRTLLRDVFPAVAAALPQARLRLVGTRPDRLLAGSTPPAGVTCTGFVDDLAAEYARASVVCCPIRAGSGTRIKILEAAAHGCAVVSTTLGAEGLDLEPGREILIADTTEALAAACVELLRDRARAQALGRAARARVAALYDRGAAESRLRSVFERELGR